MTAKEALDQLLESMPEDHLRRLLEFAQFLKWQEEREQWQEFGRAQFARAYGPDEPNYTEADLKPDAEL